MEIYEYRGVEGLVYAEVTCDDNSSETGHGYVTGEVKPLAGVAEISKSTDSSSEAHFYDNIPAIIITSTGADTITISASAIPLDVLAEITGQTYDSATGTFIEEERQQKHFAIGYKTQTTDGQEIYVFRLKGSFSSPDQTNSTKNDGTDANGQELVYTGISTTHKFSKTGKPAKAVNVNASLDLVANLDDFFDSAQTPDTIAAKTQTPSVTVIPSREAVDAGSDVQLTAQVVPSGTSVSWSSSATTYATVDSTGKVHGEAEGSATITASITVDGNTYTDTCALTVTAVTA